MAMLLSSTDGKEFELALVEDRLPEAQDASGDDTFATISFRVATDNESWEESAPCLSFYELTNLADWLETVADGGENRHDEPEIELLEPELRFAVVRAIKDDVVLRIGFHLPDRPVELAIDAETDEASHVDLRLERRRLRSAAQELRAMIREIEGSAGETTDDITGVRTPGILGVPSADLDVVDAIESEPPFAGDGEDNAGER